MGLEVMIDGDRLNPLHLIIVMGNSDLLADEHIDQRVVLAAVVGIDGDANAGLGHVIHVSVQYSS